MEIYSTQTIENGYWVVTILPDDLDRLTAALYGHTDITDVYQGEDRLVVTLLTAAFTAAVLKDRVDSQAGRLCTFVGFSVEGGVYASAGKAQHAAQADDCRCVRVPPRRRRVGSR